MICVSIMWNYWKFADWEDVYNYLDDLGLFESIEGWVGDFCG